TCNPRFRIGVITMAYNTNISPIVSNPNPFPDGNLATTVVEEASAAGTTQTTASAVAGAVVVVTNNSATNGIILDAVKGKQYIISGALAAVTKVYPPVGGAINGGAVNAALSLVSRKPGLFVCIDGLNYLAITDTTA